MKIWKLKENGECVVQYSIICQNHIMIARGGGFRGWMDIICAYTKIQCDLIAHFGFVCCGMPTSDATCFGFKLCTFPIIISYNKVPPDHICQNETVQCAVIFKFSTFGLSQTVTIDDMALHFVQYCTVGIRNVVLLYSCIIQYFRLHNVM